MPENSGTLGHVLLAQFYLWSKFLIWLARKFIFQCGTIERETFICVAAKRNEIINLHV